MIDLGLFWGKKTHYIIDTDYDNYALAYGCDNYFWVFYGEWATLLSREPFVEYPYVRKAKDKLNYIHYPYDAYWVKPGLQCGFDAAKTLDEMMVDIIQAEPDWSAYGGISKNNNIYLQ